MKIFQSKIYQTIMNYVYGWGAAAVIIGALFKIMHFPGAGVVLTIGMAVEAVIFFLSAFEPPLEHYDWSRVFPELAHASSIASEPKVNHSIQNNNTHEEVTPTPSINLGLDESDIQNLREGILKITKSADSFADITTSVPEFAQKMNHVTASFDQLGVSMQDFSEGCHSMNQALLESSQRLTDQIKTNCDKLTGSMNVSHNGFENLNKIMEEQMSQVTSQVENYTQQIGTVNKNISALNVIYELQINDTKEYLETFKDIQRDMNEVLENVSLSLDNTKLFKQESQQLANNVASLNSVYGNMLSIVNNN